MVEEDFGFEADLDQVGDHLHVICPMGVAVHTQRHEEVLSWSGQLCTHKNKEREFTLITVIHIYIQKISRKCSVVSGQKKICPLRYYWEIEHDMCLSLTFGFWSHISSLCTAMSRASL